MPRNCRTRGYETPDRIPTLDLPPLDAVTAGFSHVSIDFREGDAEGFVDQWGCRYMKSAGAPFPMCLLHPLQDIGNFEAYRWPSPDDPGVVAAFDKIAESFRAPDRAQAFHVGSFTLGILHAWVQLRGMEESMIDLLDEQAFARTFEPTVAYFEALVGRFRDAGANAVMFYEDTLAGEDRLIISPALFRSRLAPYYRRIARRVSEMGMVPIMFQSGPTWEVLADFRELGFEALCIAGINCYRDWDRLDAECRRLRLCVMTGLDSSKTFTRGTPAEVEAEVRAVVRAFGRKEGGLVLTRPFGGDTSEQCKTNGQFYRELAPRVLETT